MIDLEIDLDDTAVTSEENHTGEKYHVYYKPTLHSESCYPLFCVSERHLQSCMT